ncbi:MAG TPA: DUF1080 domain-containing protein [Vicinamibacterales bacterium]|nr:DUF1080 domain-containing protein [Vicinamibacterales bacterium]
MSRHPRRRSALLLALAAPLIAAAAVRAGQAPSDEPKAGFADAVLGRWDVTVQGTDGPYPSWFDIQLRKETELMARFVGRFGSVRHAAAVAFRDGQLTLRIPVQYEKNKTDLQFEGRVIGDRLEGTTTGETGETLKWTAVRAPSLLRDKAPSWGAPIELFSGRDLRGWKPRAVVKGTEGCWTTPAGILTASAKCVDLISERRFEDFKARIEFRYPAKGNSGVYLRGRYEVQINDDAGRAIDPLRMGGVYGFLRPWVDARRPAGEWQTFDITLIGRRVTVALNGRTIIDDEVIPGITGGALDSSEGEPGPLMLQGDHGKIEFRRITVTPAM